MPKVVFPMVLVLFIGYIIGKILSVFNENKKINNSLNLLRDKNKSRENLFSPTKDLDNFKRDDTNQLFKFKGQIQLFQYDELFNFMLSINNKTIDVSKDFSVFKNTLTKELTDLNVVNQLDLTFYTTGLNEGKYSYQFIYEPINSQSDDYFSLIQSVSQIIKEMVDIKTINKNHHSI